MSAFAISQILIAVAFISDMLSFQFKERKHVIICFVISATLIAVHFLLLGKLTAGFVVFVSVIRFVASYFTTSNKIMLLCMGLAVAAFVGTYSGFISIVALLASLIQTWGSFRAVDKQLRQGMMLGTVVWIVHNILAMTPAAVALEAFFLGSNIVGYYRFYIKKSAIAAT